MSEAQPKVVIIGSLLEPTYNLSRQLKEAGFQKVKEKQLAEAALPKGTTAEIAIFLPKTPKEPRNQIARQLRKENPSLKIVMLYDNTISGTEVADAVINANCEIDDLVKVLTYLSRMPRERATEA